MNIFKVLFFVFACGLAISAQAQEPLPLSLKIDVSGVDGIEEYPGGEEALMERLQKQIEVYFTKKYQKFWVIDPNSSLHRLEMEVEVDSDDHKPEFTFQFVPNGGSQVLIPSTKAIRSPAQTRTFNANIETALRKALKGTYDKLYSRSTQIQENWNFGVTTKIKINRPLSTEETTQFRDDQLFIVWPHAFRTTTIQTAPPEPFFHEFALSPSVPRIAKVRPSPHASMLGPASENQAKLCIQRDQPTTPQNIQPVVSYDCPVSGQCIMKTVTPEGWASGACSDQSALPSILQNLLGIGSAYANMNGEEVWTVPSLSTLYRRLKNETDTFVGFTDFEIETDALKNLEADTYTMEVFANGMPIWLNGIPPADSRHHFDAEDGILVRFGLENLTFAGRKNGCETLEVKLDFFKDNKSLDKPLILTRQYAALRHAKETVIDTPNGEARWSGLYQSPGNRKETGLFVGSSKIFHKDDKQAAIKAREFLNEKRKILDAFNWTIKRSKLGGAIGNARGTAGEDDLKIVGKIRPPTKARPNGYVAYGLLVGTEQPNGQLQFSFDWQQIKKLREILLGLRKTEGAAKDIIPASVEGFYEYTYTEERKNAPNWVCDL